MKFGSLFTGIGGFDLGFERAGMECAWQCEIDKACQQVLRKQFQGVKIYDDVRNITAGSTEPVDLICGGFPCQDVSIAGKRAGLAGERSGLWAEFARIIDELKPRWVVIENVPGLLSSNQGQDFQTVLDQMVEYGYGVCWRILDAQYFGVAQRRRRVFIVGSLGDGSSAEILFEREGVRWNPPARGKAGQGTAGDAEMCAHETGKGFWTEGLPGLRGQPGGMPENIVTAYENHPNDSRITETGDISQQLTSRMGTGGGNVPLVANTVGALQSRDSKGIGTTIDDKLIAFQRSQLRLNDKLDMLDIAPTLKSQTKSGDTELNIATSWTLRQGKEGGGKGYLGSEEKAMTLGGQQQFVGVRRLTPTECARLQGFPDDWNDFLSDSARYKQFGNAVAVPVAEWIGKRIVEVNA